MSLGLCTVWATDPRFVAWTEALGPAPNVLLSIVGVGPNKCTCRVAEETGLLMSPCFFISLDFGPVFSFPAHHVKPIVVGLLQ